MIKRKQESGNSLKTAGIFLLLVVLFILISLGIRAFFLIKESRLDKTKQFIILLQTSKKETEIIGIDSAKKSYSTLRIPALKKGTVSDFLGIPVDAKGEVGRFSSVPSQFFSFFLHKDGSVDLNTYDILKIAFLTNFFFREETPSQLSLPASVQTIDQRISSLFSDSTLSRENKSISISNATDVSGLGSKLERVINNIGGNVVAVTSSQANEKKGSITYYGEKSYTVTRLESVLHVPVVPSAHKGISDIIILIGEDNLKNSLFQ